MFSAYGGAPGFDLWAGESLELPGLLAAPLLPVVPLPAGQGQPVMLLPGFLTDDGAMKRMQRSLRAAGYRAHGWGQGHNLGARPDLLDRVGERLEELADRYGQPVALVGWSLGGVFAREAAKQRPDRAALVITLGSPFSGDLHSNNAWRIYEWLNDHPVDRLPLAVELAVKPPVPTVAVWSASDGIVAPAAARGQPGESDRQVEVGCRHLALPRSHEGIGTVGQLLAEFYAA